MTVTSTVAWCKGSHAFGHLLSKGGCGAQIEKAKASRKALGEYAARMDKLSSNESAHGNIRDDLRACDARLAAIKEQEEKARAELAALREGDYESSSGLGELFKERDMLRCGPLRSCTRSQVAAARC